MNLRLLMVGLTLALAGPAFAAGEAPAEEASVQTRARADVQRFTEGLAQAVEAYKGGDALAAAEVGELFYAFEESAFRDQLAARNPKLYKAFEAQWLTVRREMKAGADGAAIDQAHAELVAMMTEGAKAAGLGGGQSSGGATFWASFLIIFREGFEALLIIAALAAYLRKVEAAEKVKDLYLGAGIALVASLGLWGLARTVIDISGAQGELLEGFTMLLAAAVLFYLSYWLVSKVQHAQWDAFIRKQMAGAVQKGRRSAMLAVSFLVVFREGFETVLFYEALLQSADGASGVATIWAGVGTGAVVLVAMWIAIRRFGMRLPFGPFFAVTGGLLYWMAFKFAGYGMRELQAGGLIGETPVAWFPDNSFLQGWLGMYPFLETLLPQLLLFLAVVVGLIITFRPRHDAGASAPPPEGVSGEAT